MQVWHSGHPGWTSIIMDSRMPISWFVEAGSTFGDSKRTMQQLNERLAEFINRCHFLEESNKSLQRKIDEKLRKSVPAISNWKEKEQQCEHLLDATKKLFVENAQTFMEIEHCNADLTLLKTRITQELSTQKELAVKSQLHKVMKTEIMECIIDLEFDLKDKEEEKKDLELEHQKAVQAVQQFIHPMDEIEFSTVEDGRRMELSQLLNEIRTHYDTLISSSHIYNDVSNRTQLEEEARHRMEKDEEELREAMAVLSETRRQWKHFQAEIDSLQALERRLKHTLHATKLEHQEQLENLSAVIANLEQELQEVRFGVRTQLQKHKMLLNTNMKLEEEISAYRKMLEKEENRLYGNTRLLDTKPSTSKTDFVLPNGPCLGKKAEKQNEERTKITVFNGDIAKEGAEASGTIQSERVDEVIKKWEGSFFKDNPKLRKKSVSLRFDLHLAATDEACCVTKPDNLPDVEVRLVMKRSCSIPTMSP